MRLIDATRLVKLSLIERDKIPLTVEERYAFGARTPNRHGQSMRGGIRKMLRLIEQAPTIDAVPVVRCKDCLYAVPLDGHAFRRWGNNALNCTECRGDDGFGMAGVSLAYHDGFCDRGVRRDGEPHD